MQASDECVKCGLYAGNMLVITNSTAASTIDRCYFTLSYLGIVM